MKNHFQNSIVENIEIKKEKRFVLFESGWNAPE